MNATDRRVVLDASAVLAWVLQERGWDTVDRLLAVGVVPAATLVEALYRAPERGHRMRPAELHDALLGVGLRVESVTDADTVRAAELIGDSRASRAAVAGSSLSLGDGLCLAVAERLRLPVTGGDRHWETCDLRLRYLPFR